MAAPRATGGDPVGDLQGDFEAEARDVQMSTADHERTRQGTDIAKGTTTWRSHGGGGGVEGAPGPIIWLEPVVGFAQHL